MLLGGKGSPSIHPSKREPLLGLVDPCFNSRYLVMLNQSIEFVLPSIVKVFEDILADSVSMVKVICELGLALYCSFFDHKVCADRCIPQDLFNASPSRDPNIGGGHERALPGWVWCGRAGAHSVCNSNCNWHLNFLHLHEDGQVKSDQPGSKNGVTL